MTNLSIKMFFRNRIVPLLAILLAAATVLLSVACCLSFSVERTVKSVTNMFQTIPLVDQKAYAFAGEGYMSMDFEGYRKMLQVLVANPYLSKDDRRVYTGYVPNILPLRSKPKYIETAGGGYYDVSGDGGGMYWEKQYQDLVLSVTLLERIQASYGGDPYSPEYVGPGKSTWHGKEENKPNVTVGPTYTYIFRIDEVLAQASHMSPMDKLVEQKVYVTFATEEENPTGLKEGDRCLLYGVGNGQSAIIYTVLDKTFYLFPDGKTVSEEDIYSMSVEEKDVIFDDDRQMLRMSLWVRPSASPVGNPYVLLQGEEELDTGSEEAFIRTSGLNTEEGQRWYHIIQNCREGTNGLGVITTQNSRNILTFASKATQIIAGRHILPGEQESVCLISGELAEGYGLSVGDTLPMRLHRAEVATEGFIDYYSGGVKWYLRTDCEARQESPEISYRIVGIYRSLEWNDNTYANYFSPNTVFVSAAATPVIERSPEQQASWEERVLEYEIYRTLEELETEVILYTPQVLWGYYLTESDQAQAFMDSLPEEVRRNIQLLDEGYEHIQPQLEALREQMKGIVLLTLGAWVLVAALFIFLCLFRGQSAMGTLRSLGAGIGYTFRQWLLLCLCLWLVSAGVGGVLSGVLYDKIEQKVFEAASYGDAYNQAFSDLGSAAEQGYNPYEGTQGHSGESAETVYRQVKDTLHIGRVLPLTILAQGGVFLLLCAVTLACLTRRKVPKLLRSV